MQLEELIRSYKEGDNNSIIYLLNKFSPIIKKYSKMLNGDPKDHSEFIIFLMNLFKSMPCDLNEESRIVKYIAKSLRHEYIRLMTQKRKMTKHEISLEQLSNINLHNNENLVNIDIASSLIRLSYLQRRVIFLIFYRGEKEHEIATRLNITRQAVNKIKNSALRKMREYLV